MDTLEISITKTLIAEPERLGTLPRYLGKHYLEFEMSVYGFMDRFCEAWLGRAKRAESPAKESQYFQQLKFLKSSFFASYQVVPAIFSIRYQEPMLTELLSPYSPILGRFSVMHGQN